MCVGPKPLKPHRCITLSLVCVLVAACAACVPDGGSMLGIVGYPQSETDPLGQNAPPTVGGAPTRPGEGNGSGTVTTGPPTGAEFAPLSPQMAALRVKNVLTGMVPSSAEYQAVVEDSNALGTLVDSWLASQAYRDKMEVFWADAFQQSQAQAEDFHLGLDDTWFTPTDALLLNFRQSFAKTVGQLTRNGKPFTEAATTQTYMMTTAMMVYLAYADTALQGDSPSAGIFGPRQNRFLMQNADWNYTLQKRGGMVPIADSANPASSNYLKFYIPTLGSDSWRSPGSDNQGDAAYCKQFDPVVMTKAASFEYEQGLTKWLYAALKGDEYRFFNPPQGAPNERWCAASPSPSVITDQDHSDWRMVTITAPQNPRAQSKFYDLAGLRAATTLAIYSPRVGYFTTPAFFSQYTTNVSNQARSIANQTLITGLGRAFDGTATVKLTNPPGLNAQHASDPACMACHMNLDPMRQFFRANYSLTFSAQLDPGQQNMPGTFGFDGVMMQSRSMVELGKAIADHPRFKIAWTQKLCNWANSTVCDVNDPELVRIAELFAASGYSWQVLAKAMFTSPLTTYLAPTQTAQKLGVTAPIARRSHLCAALDARLGLTDSCGLLTLQNGLAGSPYTNLAYNLPKDAYSRGAVDGIYVTAPDLFYRNVVENMCSLLADRVVDTSGPVTFSSSSPQTAIDNLTHTLLGLNSGRDEAVGQVLMAHYTEVRAAGMGATQALKSTFVLACQSPLMVSVGQ